MNAKGESTIDRLSKEKLEWGILLFSTRKEELIKINIEHCQQPINSNELMSSLELINNNLCSIFGKYSSEWYQWHINSAYDFDPSILSQSIPKLQGQ